MVLPSITEGIAKTTMKDVTSIDQTKTGMRLTAMPGARCLNTVTMVLTAMQSDESSVKVIICAQTSTRLPGENCGPESGVYANQPASGAALVAREK